MLKHKSKAKGEQRKEAPYAVFFGKAACPVRYESSQEDKLRFWGVHVLRLLAFFGLIGVLVVAKMALGAISSAVQVVLIAFIISFLLCPLVDKLEAKGLSRIWGTLIGFLLAVLIVLVFSAMVMPVLIDQVGQFISSIPGYISQVEQFVSGLYAKYGSLLADSQVRGALTKVMSSVSSAVWDFANNSAAGIFGFGTSLASAATTFFMALVVAFWLTMDFPKFRRESLILVGPKRAEDFEIVSAVFVRALGGYIKGLIITSACTGVLAGVGFFILGVPYAGLLGLATAILNIIPFIGPWIGGAIAALVSLFVSPFTAIMSIVVTIVAQQFTDTFISPKVMQSAVSVHPALVIVGLVAGGAVGGVVGMIFIVPFIAAIKGVFIYYFERKTGRQLVSEEGGLFKGQPYNDELGHPVPAFDATGGSKYYAARFVTSDNQEAVVAARKLEEELEQEEDNSKLDDVKDKLVEKAQELLGQDADNNSTEGKE